MKLTPHRPDAVSFGFGLVFLATTTLWVIANFVDVRPATVGWLFAGAMLMLGGLGIARTLRSGPDRDQSDPGGV